MLFFQPRKTGLSPTPTPHSKAMLHAFHFEPSRLCVCVFFFHYVAGAAYGNQFNSNERLQISMLLFFQCIFDFIENKTIFYINHVVVNQDVSLQIDFSRGFGPGIFHLCHFAHMSCSLSIYQTMEALIKAKVEDKNKWKITLPINFSRSLIHYDSTTVHSRFQCIFLLCGFIKATSGKRRKCQSFK